MCSRVTDGGLRRRTCPGLLFWVYLGHQKVWGWNPASMCWVCITYSLMSSRDWEPHPERDHSFFAKEVLAVAGCYQRDVRWIQTQSDCFNQMTVNDPFSPKVSKHVNRSLERYDFKTHLTMTSMIVLLGIINHRGYFRVVFFLKIKSSFLWNEGPKKFKYII